MSQFTITSKSCFTGILDFAGDASLAQTAAVAVEAVVGFDIIGRGRLQVG